MKYSLEEIKEMLLEPSFDAEAWIDKTDKDEPIVEVFFKLLKEAIEYHEKLSNSNNGENL